MTSKVLYAFGLIACSLASTGCFGQSALGDSHTSTQCPGQPATDVLSSSESKRIPPQERQALIAIYEATDGTHWKDKNGWLGDPGSECTWKGVMCGSRLPGPTTVTSLTLSENNLRGAIPEAAGQLTHLENLDIYGNALSGKLPEAWIRRSRTGELFIAAEDSLLTDVTAIDFESSSSSVICAKYRIVLHSDRTAVQYTERCRNATPDDRASFCEVKEGRAWGFARLGWLLEENGFFALRENYDLSVTDSTFESLRVIRNGKSYEVIEYAGAGPQALWVIHRSIEGVASSIEWEKTTKQPKCPRWSEPEAKKQ